MTAPDAFGESSEVSWPLGETTVYGTVVRPSGPGPFPGVVLVAGSGPTHRDWNSPLLPGPNGSGRLLAEMLGRAGIASLRYEKRASGPHVRETIPHLIGRITMQSHVDELAGAVRTLAAEGWVRGDRIFALGNSEGALHALNYELESPPLPLTGLILTGPPGRAVGVVTRSQLAAQAAGIPNGEALLALYDAAIARFLAGEPARTPIPPCRRASGSSCRRWRPRPTCPSPVSSGPPRPPAYWPESRFPPSSSSARRTSRWTGRRTGSRCGAVPRVERTSHSSSLTTPITSSSTSQGRASSWCRLRPCPGTTRRMRTWTRRSQPPSRLGCRPTRRQLPRHAWTGTTLPGRNPDGVRRLPDGAPPRSTVSASRAVPEGPAVQPS